jgi:hypothetical protein
MWYNSVTNQLQSNPPWDGYLSPAMIVESYPEWTQVAVGFVPPVPAPTKSQQLTALTASYTPQLQALQLATGAALLNNAALMTAADFPTFISLLSAAITPLQQQNTDLLAQKKTQQGVILSGNS